MFWGSLGGGLALTAACFTGAAAWSEFSLWADARSVLSSPGFRAQRKARPAFPHHEHQAVGYGLADAKWPSKRPVASAGERAKRSMCNRPARRSWRSKQKSMVPETLRCLDGSHASRRIESYDTLSPLGTGGPAAGCGSRFPLFGGGNIGVRRRQLHGILKTAGYDPLMTSSEREV